MSSNLAECSSEDSSIQFSDRNDDVICSGPSIGSTSMLSNESVSPPSIKGTEKLRAVHELRDMGFSMNVVLEAIKEVKSTDTPTLLNHILFLGMLSNL